MTRPLGQHDNLGGPTYGQWRALALLAILLTRGDRGDYHRAGYDRSHNGVLGASQGGNGATRDERARIAYGVAPVDWMRKRGWERTTSQYLRTQPVDRRRTASNRM